MEIPTRQRERVAKNIGGVNRKKPIWKTGISQIPVN